jgi:hypothetical protein
LKAAVWLDRTVSPPTGGISTAVRMDPAGGLSRKLKSLYHAGEEYSSLGSE